MPTLAALARLSPALRHLLDGIELADSLALDPHKSLHVPFEAGCVLVRDPAAHLHSFALHAGYLDPPPRALARSSGAISTRRTGWPG